MHICIVGPIDGAGIKNLLDNPEEAPYGYPGAPLMSILIEKLIRRGHKITAITSDKTIPISSAPVRTSGSNFTFIAIPQRPRAWVNNGALRGRIVDLFSVEIDSIHREIQSSSPDIIHAHWTYEFALAALNHSAPHLITCHDAPSVVFKYTKSPYRLLRWIMANKVFKNGKNFSVVSSYLLNKLSKNLKSNTNIINNPVTDKAFNLYSTRKHPSTRKIAMICNGWDDRKNPKPAIEAFSKYKETTENAELHLFGSDFGVGEVAQKWTESQKLSGGIYFHGRTGHSDLINSMKDMDVLLHPALEESFGVVIAEAMALGLPIIAGKDSGGVASVLGADEYSCLSGILTDVKSIRAITESIIEIFNNDYCKKSIFANNYARSKYYSESIAIQYETCYFKILANASS